MINVSLDKCSIYSVEFSLEFWFQLKIRKSTLNYVFLIFELFILCYYHYTDNQ